MNKKTIITSIMFISLISFIVFISIKLYYLNLLFKKNSKISENFKLIQYEDIHRKEVLQLLHENFYWLTEGIKEEDYNFGEQLDKKLYINKFCNESKPLSAFVIKDDFGNVIGFITFYRADTEVMTIHLLCVSNKYRRMGLGEKLMRFAIEQIWQDKIIKYIYLIARKDNLRGHNLYKKLGFQVFDEKDEFINSYVLEKSNYNKI